MKKSDTRPKINASGPEKNSMPKNPSLQQRIDWHHALCKTCGCMMTIPGKMKAEVKKL